MTVICEECGKIYHVDPYKIETYKNKNIKVRCGECNHVTKLSNLIDVSSTPVASYVGEPEPEPDLLQPEESDSSPPGMPEELKAASSRQITGSERRKGWIGLRGKMFFLFFLIPIILMAVSGGFSQWQLNILVDEITDESTVLLTEAGEALLLQKARDIAFQAEIYLRGNPELERTDFAYDPAFNYIAVQAVGSTGYTTLIEEPSEQDGSTFWTIWAHPNPNLVGMSDMNAVRASIGPHFDSFYDLLMSAMGGKEITGEYRWPDPDGVVREKFMAVVPINVGGARYVIMATSNIEEFEQRTDSLRESAQLMTTQTLYVNLGIFLGAIFVIGLCIIVYGYRLTRKIQYLTDVADRISVGDMEAEIEIRSKDEIGSLADAISRMQDSLRFSIERLRRRRR